MSKVEWELYRWNRSYIGGIGAISMVLEQNYHLAGGMGGIVLFVVYRNLLLNSVYLNTRWNGGMKN